MDFLTGYNIKPYEVRSTGEVFFTDGTNNDLGANQLTCEAYGYTYDRDTGTCRAFTYKSNLNTNIRNINNKFNGPQNTAEVGCEIVQINGTNNTAKGSNINCFINGSNNEIAEGINDATVLGVGGKAETNGETVLGGGLNEFSGGGTTVYADRKRSMINLSGVTVDNTATELAVNAERDSLINVKINSVLGFEIYITRLEVAGSAATLGNYSYRNIKGVVRIDNSGTMAFIVGFTRNIGKIGVNGTAAMVESAASIAGGDPSITIEVEDRNNVTNIWSATVYTHELISTSITF
jgi:RNase P/RNase MRP subunit p29